MKKLMIVTALFISVGIYAQKTNKRNKSDSVGVMIIKERDSLVTKLTTGDTLNEKKIFDVLKNYGSGGQHMALYPFEKWLLYYYFGDYEEILQDVRSCDSAYYQSLKSKIYPPYDNLGSVLISVSESYMTQTLNDIDITSFSAEEKDFLKLLFRYCLSENVQSVSDQDTLNKYSDVFIKQNANSEFVPFIKDNIKFKILPSNSALAFDFSIGVGNYTRSLSNSFGQNGYVTLSIEYDYRKLNFSYRLSGSSSGVSKSFAVGNIIWPAGIHPGIGMSEFSVGYNIIDFHFIRITPFSGISKFKLVQDNKDIQTYPKLKGSKLKTWMYTIGGTADIKYRLHWFDKTLGSHNYNFGFVRIRYGYNFPSNDHDGNIGNMNYLTIGWGLIFRGVKFEK